MTSSSFSQSGIFKFRNLIASFTIVTFMLLSALNVYAEEPAVKSDKDGSEIKAANSPAPEPANKTVTVNGLNVVFTGNNEAIVEVNGQLVKINTAQQSVTPVSPASAPAPTANADSPKKSPGNGANKPGDKAKTGGKTAEAGDIIDPETYYAYELINVPTPRAFEKNAFAVHFTHRFSQSPFVKAAPDLYGLDSFSVSAFGFSYGVTNRLYAKIYRSPINRTIEIGGGFHLLHQGEKNPFSASVYTSVEGKDNFNENFTTNIVGMIGHAFSHYGSAFFAPTISINTNPFNDPHEPNNTGSFGFGGQVNIRPTVSLLCEFTPRNGYILPGSVSEVAFGLQKRTYRHVFTLTLSNTQGTTTSQYNIGFGSITDRKMLSRGLVIGFNIYRRLF